MIGNRRPISYFREIIYGLTEHPYIAVERMEHTGQISSKTAWMFKDNISSWTWTGYEGIEASVDVYSSADEVELFLNGKSLGKSLPESNTILQRRTECHINQENFSQSHIVPEKPSVSTEYSRQVRQMCCVQNK